MRILFLHTAQNGLTAEYKVHLSLAKYAGSGALDPYFIWQSPIETDWVSADRIIPFDFGRNMSITPLPGRFHRAGMVIQKFPQILRFLISKIKEIKPDIIYTSQQNFDVHYATILAALFHIPHVIHLHYNVGPWLGNYVYNTVRKSSRLIAVSEYIRETALLQGVSPSAIHTIINPSPVQQTRTDIDCRSIRAEFHLDDNVPLIATIGRLDPGKGHLDLFKAFSQVIKQMPNARLLLCGTSTSRDHYEDWLRQRAEELQITPFTIFAGYRNDIPAILRSSNVFCLPTELDPCPIVFLEAMAEGLPVVAYYSGGVPEMILHRQTGLLSYPGDIQALAANLQNVLSDAVLAQQLGEAGKKRVMTEFAPERIANRWLKVLQEKSK